MTMPMLPRIARRRDGARVCAINGCCPTSSSAGPSFRHLRQYVEYLASSRALASSRELAC